eukprot:TRINITY_DN9352_c0_g1_i1.p1 TRINITY_DN9352_c0_g1~~TRINITY_DN9352_c0_g1_i1.p1  ORF type:complete len:389 (+),score=63.46 TRINITY_DN9352_c0_g1_i1:364-1530(+)
MEDKFSILSFTIAEKWENIVELTIGQIKLFEVDIKRWRQRPISALQEQEIVSFEIRCESFRKYVEDMSKTTPLTKSKKEAIGAQVAKLHKRRQKINSNSYSPNPATILSNDHEATTLWRLLFDKEGRSTIDYDEFSRWCQAYLPQFYFDMSQMAKSHLKGLLCRDEKVDLDRFCNVLLKFGPLTKLAANFLQLFEQPWYHNLPSEIDAGQKKAEELLAGHPQMTFLLRPDRHETGFVLSFVSRANARESRCEHQRIHIDLVNQERLFFFGTTVDENTAEKSLVALVEKWKEVHDAQPLKFTEDQLRLFTGFDDSDDDFTLSNSFDRAYPTPDAILFSWNAKKKQYRIARFKPHVETFDEKEFDRLVAALPKETGFAVREYLKACDPYF